MRRYERRGQDGNRAPQVSPRASWLAARVFPSVRQLEALAAKALDQMQRTKDQFGAPNCPSCCESDIHAVHHAGARDPLCLAHCGAFAGNPRATKEPHLLVTCQNVECGHQWIMQSPLTVLALGAAYERNNALMELLISRDTLLKRLCAVYETDDADVAIARCEQDAAAKSQSR